MRTFFETTTFATFVAVVTVLLLESLARAVAFRSVATAAMALSFALRTGGDLPGTTNSTGELMALAEVSSSIWGATSDAVFATAALALAKAPAFLVLAVFMTEALALAKVPAFLVLLVTRPLATSAVTSDFISLVLATSVAGDFLALVTIAGCLNSMKWMDDSDGLQWIGHMNSIAAQVASCRKLPVERERTTNKEARGWNKSCDRWPGDVENAYAVITKNRRIAVTIVEYHGMSQQKMRQ